MQNAFLHAQGGIGRDDIDLVGLHPHRLMNLAHRQVRMAADEFGQHSRMMGILMRNGHKGQAAIIGHGPKETLESL